MTRQDLLDFSADAIGKPWTVEAHQTLVAGLRDIIAGQRVQHIRPVFHADGDPVDDAHTQGYFPVDPEEAEI